MIYGAIIAISSIVGIWLASRLVKAVTDSFDKKHPDPSFNLLCVRHLGVVLAILSGVVCGPILTGAVMVALPIVALMVLFGYPTTRALTEGSSS